MSKNDHKRLLAISGKRFSGKDTLASLLIEKAKGYGITLHPHAFASESKRLFAEREKGIDLARLMNDREYKESIRPRLTAFTVESINADPLVFCRSVADQIDAEQEGSPMNKPNVAKRSEAFESAEGRRDVHQQTRMAECLITDVRLRLEVDHLRSRFRLHLVRILRSDAARTSSGWSFNASADEHHTETELDDASLWDETITNDGTVDELAAKADTLIKKMGLRGASRLQ